MHRVSLKISCDNRPIFQAKHINSIRAKTFTHLPDVREALIATYKMKSEKEKEYYFMSVGLDYKRTQTYYPTVIELNRLWDKTKIEKPKTIWVDFIKNLFD